MEWGFCSLASHCLVVTCGHYLLDHIRKCEPDNIWIWLFVWTTKFSFFNQFHSEIWIRFCQTLSVDSNSDCLSTELQLTEEDCLEWRRLFATNLFFILVKRKNERIPKRIHRELVLKGWVMMSRERREMVLCSARGLRLFTLWLRQFIFSNPRLQRSSQVTLPFVDGSLDHTSAFSKCPTSSMWSPSQCQIWRPSSSPSRFSIRSRSSTRRRCWDGSPFGCPSPIRRYFSSRGSTLQRCCQCQTPSSLCGIMKIRRWGHWNESSIKESIESHLKEVKWNVSVERCQLKWKEKSTEKSCSRCWIRNEQQEHLGGSNRNVFKDNSKVRKRSKACHLPNDEPVLLLESKFWVLRWRSR